MTVWSDAGGMALPLPLAGLSGSGQHAELYGWSGGLVALGVLFGF